MLVQESEIIAVLRQLNPWWLNQSIPDLPPWRRAASKELDLWLQNPPSHRAILLSGARQIGKTTLFLQSIQELLNQGVPPANIIYVTLDHPILKLAGLENTLKAWQSSEKKAAGTEYLFIDEIQFFPNWQTWLKHQADFQKRRRIAVTGSATPLMTDQQESGVGRWHTIPLATLSFYEFLKIQQKPEPDLPKITSLRQLFDWHENEFSRTGILAETLVVQFHEYLQRGGFPQCALAKTTTWAQKLLREDIVDKVLKRDMTALFGIRRVLELEHIFLYLCMHDGGLLDIPELCKNLSLKKPTVLNYIELLAATHLIYKLSPFGYGKEVLRGKHKVYLADPAIGPSVLSKSQSILEDNTLLGNVVETAFFKHVYTHYYNVNVKFSFWRGKKDHEVDIVAETGDRVIPFEIKYRGQHTGLSDLKGLREFCLSKKIEQAYVITRDMTDFGSIHVDSQTTFLKIPAPLACYWLGKAELGGN